MLLAKLETVYTGSGGPGSSMVGFLIDVRHIVFYTFRLSVIALIYAVGIEHGARTSCMDRMVSF